MESLKSLNKYVEVLVDQYPVSMTQTELAQKSGVTKSAISKVRNRLLELCDMRVVAFERKMVLRSDFETFERIFHHYFLRLRAERLFESKYAKHVLNEMQIYEKLSKSLERFSFSKYFDKEDVNWAINLVLQNVSSFQIQKDTFSVIASALGSEIESRELSEVIPYIQLVTRLLTDFQVVLETEVDLNRTLLLRDKLYFFVKNNLSKVLVELDVVNEIEDEEEKKAREELLSVIALHYLNKAIKQITQHIQKESKRKGIQFLKEYGEIGTFFHNQRAGNLVGKALSAQSRS